MQLTCSYSGFRAAFFSHTLVQVWLALSMLMGIVQHAYATGVALTEWQSKAGKLNLYSSNTWQALLHLQEGKPDIDDPGFLLTHAHFSAEAELNATLDYLHGPKSAQAVCKYPARYLWLQRMLALPSISMEHCQTLQEFIRRAPADRISLVFASENLSQPSSMMGHLFLKLEGQRQGGAPVSHAIAFFTDADTLNLPKLLYDSMIVGKLGFFTLSPYQDEVQLYAVEEQRSLWEYELKLDEFDRKLMQAHMHELRQARITYFFQNFNCATLVQQILAIVEPKVLAGRGWWTTPKGVLQSAKAADLVESITVKTPSRWRVRTLRDTLPTEELSTVRALVDRRGPLQYRDTWALDDGPRGYLQLELARAYNTYLLEQHRIDTTEWRNFASQLEALQQHRYPGLSLQADEGKNPANAPPERQISLGWLHHEGHSHIRLGLQPVSHALIDDNRHLLSESELRLFDSALLIEPRRGRIKLDHFTLYAVESLLPRDEMTGGQSGRFKIGLERQPQLRQPDKNAWLIEGAGGYTWRLGDDVNAFALMGGGWGMNEGGYLYAMPSVGVVIREVFDMKTVVRLSEVSRPLGQRNASRDLTVTQAKYLDRHNSLVLTWRRIWQDGRAANEGQILLKHLF